MKTSLQIVLTDKPHANGEYLISPAIRDAAILNEIEKLSLSNNIVLRRIDEVS